MSSSSSSSSDPTTTDATADTTPNFQSDLAADRNGYFARLADRVFGSGGDGFLATFADEQRLERLDGCQALEGDLTHCTRLRRKLEEAEVERAQRLEEEESGERGRGGFWGRRANKSTNAAVPSQEDKQQATTTEEEMDPYYIPSQSSTKARIARFYDWGEPDSAEALNAAAAPANCHRESHSVWACRAMAVGCADHLVPLRKCLQRTGTTAVHYEGNAGATEDGGEECMLEQQAMAQCVNVKLDELDKRFRDRQQRAK